ncbi:MAG: family 10 glycosylhydrolase, partial [Microcystis sp. M53598_WE2]
MLHIHILQDTFFKSSTAFSETLNSGQKSLIKAGTKLPIKSYFRQNNHYSVKLAAEQGSVGKAGFFFDDHVQVEEIRGVWLTNVDSDILKSKDNLKAGLEKLKNLGFNTLYLVVWNKGYVFFQSQIADNVFTADKEKLKKVNLEKELVGRDLLAEI